MRRELDVSVTGEERLPSAEDTATRSPPNEDPGTIMPRKRFWLVRAVTDEAGTRPDIPEGIAWVGNTDGKWYVVVTSPDVEVPGGQELSFEEAARVFSGFMDGIRGDDVGEKWGVR